MGRVRCASVSTSLHILDGAMGTELERRGVELPLPLWTSHALLHAPEEIKAVHRDCVAAGATILTAATFRTHARTVAAAGIDADPADLVHRAIELARDAAGDSVQVFGSVGPLEDCYSPELTPEFDVCYAEQRAHLEHMKDAGADGVLLETFGTRRGASAAARAARDVFPERWMISFLCRPGATPGTLFVGTPLVDVLPTLDGAMAIGLTCTPAPELANHLRVLRTLVDDDIPLIAQGNTATIDDHGAWVATNAESPEEYAGYARTWRDLGASYIGGCCGTTPATIQAISAALT